jgi:hypothetical protein
VDERPVNQAFSIIILLILGFGLFGGLYLVVYRMQKIDTIKHIDDRVRLDVQKQLAEQRTAISPLVRKVAAGSQDAFGVGARNELDQDLPLYVRSECESAVGAGYATLCDESEMKPCDKFDRWLTTEPGIGISKGYSWIGEIIVRVPQDAKTGTYTFEVKVCEDASCSATYDTPRLLRVIVP